MATQEQDSRGYARSPTSGMAPDADAGQVAEAMVAIWQAVDAALSPILGPRGVAALYQRSIFLTSPAHPWLAPLHEGIDGRLDLPALKTQFARQGSGPARAGGDALLEVFQRLLASLVGDSLTERLLRSVWSDPSPSPPKGTPP